VLERLDEETTCTASRVENHFAEFGIEHFHYKTDHGARGIKLAGIAGGVAHLLKHGLLEMAKGAVVASELISGNAKSMSFVVRAFIPYLTSKP
jgi:hypothetical protein